MFRLPQPKHYWRAVGVVIGVLTAAELASWTASHCLLGEVDAAGAVPGGEAVVVLGHADLGPTAGKDNRRRLRAGLRSRRLPDSRLILSGGAVAGPVPEAELMARYATGRLGYTGPLELETGSRSTWENIAAVAR
ncbi:YdcF family protein [Actinomyces ruminis]|uniref:YdcF family protein n=1 Tax=Actinomyces ruminis TaxID=1937003 RepID=UPI001C55819B|nr:YdcF family protein [Actinomyces ruminis]